MSYWPQDPLIQCPPRALKGWRSPFCMWGIGILCLLCALLLGIFGLPFYPENGPSFPSNVSPTFLVVLLVIGGFLLLYKASQAMPLTPVKQRILKKEACIDPILDSFVRAHEAVGPLRTAHWHAADRYVCQKNHQTWLKNLRTKVP